MFRVRLNRLLIKLCGFGVGGIVFPATLHAADVRVQNYLFQTDQIHVEIEPYHPILSSPPDKYNLHYGEESAYHSYGPGKYRIQVRTATGYILDKTLGLGPDGHYSIVVFGLNPSSKRPVNDHTLKHALLKMVEGAATENSNGYKPQLFIKNDYYERLNQSARISFINLLPGSQDWKARFYSDTDSNDPDLSLENQEYAKESDRKTLHTGVYDVQFSLQNSDAEDLTQRLKIEPSTYYRLYLIPNSHAYLTHPRLVITQARK